MMSSQRSDVEKISLIEEGKYIGINEVIRRNEIINNNWNRTQNYLVLTRTLNHLAKWLTVCLRTKWFWVRVQLQSLHLQISLLL